MSNNMDKDIFNMDTINSLMEDMFSDGKSTAEMMEKAVSKELNKMGGGLESFMDEESARAEQYDELHKHGLHEGGGSEAIAIGYVSQFNGTRSSVPDNQHELTDGIAFEKDDQNSSLAGVKTAGTSSGDGFWIPKTGISDGIEDIHDFFAVGRGQKDVDYDLTEIDEQTIAMQKLSESEKRELDAGFVRDMGMDLNRLRQVAGATSAWQEIASIKSELQELSVQSNRLIRRFEEFIDIYVKDKIPK